ncbi:MAG: LacI family DNA-binding transcriptional regulator [Planctomycetota bacterium]
MARECNVATSTVSRVLSNTYPENFNVRPEVRDRIVATARKLRYVPHAAARQLQTSRSMSIGIIAFRMTDRSHAVIVERVEELLYNKGYLAWVGYVREQPDTFDRYVREFASRQADGVLCLDRTITPKQRKLLAEMHPRSVFYIGEEADGEGLCTVDVDRREATRQVLEHLAEKGYRRVGMVLNRCCEPIDRLRLEVWRQVGATRGLEIDDSLVFECNLLDGPHGPVSAERAVERLVEGCGVDALFCGSERQAMYV